MAPSLSVQNNPTLDRFELWIGDTLAGVAEYQDTAGERAFVHTEVYPGHEGQGHGHGHTLVRTALDATRAEGYGVLPMCTMVRRFLRENAQYQTLVPHWAREDFGLP